MITLFGAGNHILSIRYLNAYRSPFSILRRIGRAVANAVNAAEISDYLLVDVIEILQFICAL